ncbi:MAG: hypothetical protein AAF840_01885 [Bacteroidota bacterium]
MVPGILPTPPPTGDAFGLLLDAVREMTAELKENNRLRRKESNPWMTAVEAAEYLGINVKYDDGKPTTYHRRVLAQMHDTHLSNYSGDRSTKYDRKQVMALLDKERRDPAFFILRRLVR